MIGYLNGKLVEVEGDFCLLDVAGVGYLVYCSESTLHQLRKKLTENNQSVQLFTRLLHREDVLDLYGFLHRDEYTLFNMLLKVSGIGPKQALKILGIGKTREIVRAIISGDDSFLMQLSGIGKKRAQQIIFDLKEKLHKAFDVRISESTSEYATAVSALESLGFSANEAGRAVEKVLSSHAASYDISEIIEYALKLLSTGVKK
jgi:Holliday junction DNA helicase RuvA